LFPQSSILGEKPATLEGPGENHPQLGRVDRLLKEVESAECHGFQGIAAFSLARHHDDGRVRLALPDFLQEVQPLLDLSRGGKPHVEKVNVGYRLAEVAALPRIARGKHFKLVFERPGKLIEEDRIVFDDQDTARHGAHAGPPAAGTEETSVSAEEARAEPGNFSRTSVPPPACEWTRMVPRWSRTI
jgi:hypothetical protein